MADKLPPLPPRRISVFDAVDKYPTQTDELYPEREVLNRESGEGRKFVALPKKVREPLIGENDLGKAIIKMAEKDGLSEGILTQVSEANLRANFIKNACQDLSDEGKRDKDQEKIRKADELFKMGYERLLEHFTKANERAAIGAIHDKLEELDTFPSGEKNETWLKSMTALPTGKLG